MRFQDNMRTQYVVDAILDMDTQVSEEISETEFWKSIEQQAPFQDGLDDRIVKLGYDGEPDDVPAKVKFISSQFKKNGVEPISSVTLKNWYVKAGPSDDKNGRANVYKLCFALEMNAIETAEFFFKAYRTRPFNYKDTAEAVYYWCLLNGKSYSDAVRLIAEIDSVATDIQADRDIATEEIGSEISYISDEPELVKYLSEHRYDKSEQHKTVTDKIDELLKHCYEAATQETKYTSEKPRTVESTDMLLDVIYDYDEAQMSAPITQSKLPKALKTYWPNRQTLENIKKHNIGAEDLYRRPLILLTFYDFYAKAYVEQRKKKSEPDIDMVGLADEFEDEINEVLAKCGYIQFYKRNPFDGLIYLCTSYPNPLSQFRQIIAEFYLDEVDSAEK